MAKSSPLFKEYFVAPELEPESLFQWKRFDCDIQNQTGESVFRMSNVEAPSHWSQLAVEIAASKYFRQKGVGGAEVAERSIRQLVQRVVKAMTQAGHAQKYFSNPGEAKVFQKELTYILLSQRASFNSPVWFNCGLYQSYGIDSPSTHFVWDAKKKKAVPAKGAYRSPQVSACFIQKVEDSLEGIFNLLQSEAKLFKYGSGSGTNFSNLRSKYENISGGGTSSGLLSFLEVLDRAAGSIKSGGVTRRAAKMVCLDVDHPEAMDFIEWKAKEEKKAQALIGAGYEADFEGEAYRTVSGQNSNNSVRVTDRFLSAVEGKKNWRLKSRTTRKTIQEIPAQEMWEKIVSSAWTCADPGLQFHDTIQEWHTCPESGEIRASNPCSEYMFLDDSACNLASLNLLAFLKSDGSFDWEAYEHSCQIVFLAQDILVDFASYPTAPIAENSHLFRPLGLGFAGLGALLMRMGISYDSEEGRSWAGALSASLHGTAYRMSARLAKKMGAFEAFKRNREAMLKVIQKHRKALKHIGWSFLPSDVKARITEAYDELILLGKKSGFRNSQATVMAPTGTIGLVMDCETTGIEPEFSLIRFKKMVGGGKTRMVSQSVRPALQKLNYSEAEITEIEQHIQKTGMIESAPHLRPEHLPVFDCASRNGLDGKRFLKAEAHLKMMASIQPFISGAISKTVNLPAETTVGDVSEIYWQAWKMGLKAIAIYRDGSKMSQPLSASDKGPVCPECGGGTEIAGGCYRCTNCGFTTGCLS